MNLRSGLALWLASMVLHPSSARAEDLLREGGLDSFRAVEAWHRVSEVAAVVEKSLLETKGIGAIVVNGAEKNLKIPFLMTKGEFGDVRVELEFMVPRGSNSGVYLMGRYEVQILDSFGWARMNSDDLGGIYQRWDPTRPKGHEGFEGTPPRSNAAKAPGEWQSLEIIFRAPQFDPAGKKIKDATFEKVVVNGVVVQENATTSGPTRSAAFEGDALRGPIAIQGDHGPIAIRKFHVTSLDAADQQRLHELDAYWSKVSSAVKEGDFAAYQDTIHPEGVLVSGNKRMTQPLAAALARWKKEFDDTRDGKMRASVEFRFSRRLGDVTTAHESGIFCYTSQLPGDPPKVEYVRFEGLMVKHQGAWKILMENQQGSVTVADWQALLAKP